ncbi:hypothetical protein KI387_005023, partial [Taxus chinensis]
MEVKQKSFPWNMDSDLLRTMITTHQQMIRTMQQIIQRMDVDRTRGRRDSLRVRQDRRPRSSSLSIHRSPTPQDKEAEVISIFEEYSILPQDVKENFPFMNYMDMHPSIGYKTEQARKEYHTRASKCFNLSPYSHEIAALTHGEKNEEESTSVGIQSTCAGYENSTEDALVKLEDMAKEYDRYSDFYDNSHVSLPHHERMLILHEDDNAMGSSIGGIQELGVKNGFCVMNSSHKNSDFLYQNWEDVTKTQLLCDMWSQKAKEARLVAANARQHLQGVKEKINLINIARNKRIDECVEEDMPSHLSQQLVHNNIHPIPDKNEGELVQQSQAVVKSKIDVDVGDTPRYDKHNNGSYLLLPSPIYFHHRMHDMVEDEVFILEFVEPLVQIYEQLVEGIWWQVIAHLTGTGARCVLCSKNERWGLRNKRAFFRLSFMLGQNLQFHDSQEETDLLWELKMMQTGAVLERTANPPPRGPNVPTPVHDLNVPYEPTEEYETPTAEMLFPPTPLETPMQTPLPGITESAVYQYMPQGPSDYTSMSDSGMGGDIKLGRPAPYMQQPSAWINQRPLGVDVNIAYEEGRDEDDTGVGQPPLTKDFFTLSAGKRKREEFTSNYLPGGYIPQQDGAADFILEFVQEKKVQLKAGSSTERLTGISSTQTRNEADLALASIIKSKHSSQNIPQLDGIDENADDANEDYNAPTEQDPSAVNDALRIVKAEENDDDEPPLNEDDDDEIDEIDQGGEEPNTSHLVLAQFEKVTRTKSRWKCTLKDGIMHLNNKDILFAK